MPRNKLEPQLKLQLLSLLQLAFETTDMNVAPWTFVSPRSCFSVTTFETQPDAFSNMTSAGYSHGAGSVNASDRPQIDKGYCSSGATPKQNQATTLGVETPMVSEAANQRHCFRLDLSSPYGHVLV